MNPHYTSDLLQCRETTRSVTAEARQSLPKEKHVIIKGAHSAIIYHEEFETVQHMIKTRKKNITKAKKIISLPIFYTVRIAGQGCGIGKTAWATFVVVVVVMLVMVIMLVVIEQ